MRNYGNTCYFNSALQCLKKIYDVEEDHWGLLCRFRTRFSQFTPGVPHDAQEALMCLIDLFNIKEVEGTMLQEVVCRSGRVKTEVLTTVISVQGTGCQTLGECIAKHQLWTTITGYTDNFGTTHNVAAIRTVFQKFPKVLVVSLNEKMVITVAKNLKIGDHHYELLASCVHLGDQHGGHYVALVKEGDTWLLKNDEETIQVDFPCRHSHYILVYKLLNS
jgi:hypothetical protein